MRPCAQGCSKGKNVMDKGKIAIFFARLGVSYWISHTLSTAASSRCCTKNLSHGTQGLGLAQGRRGGRMEGTWSAFIPWWSHHTTKELGKAFLAQTLDTEKTLLHTRESRETFVLNQFLHIGKVLAVELNSLSTETAGILGSCCLSRCINSVLPLPGSASHWVLVGFQLKLCNGAARAEWKIQEPTRLGTWPEVLNQRALPASLSSATSCLCTLNTCWVQFSASSSASSPAAEPTDAAVRISLPDKEKEIKRAPDVEFTSVRLNISTGPLEESTLDLPKWASLSKIWLQNSPRGTWGKIPDSEERLLTTWAPQKACSLFPLPFPAEFDSWLWISTLVLPAKDNVWILVCPVAAPGILDHGFACWRDMSSSSSLPSPWGSDSCRPVCIILHRKALTDITGMLCTLRGSVQFPALQDPGCTFNHYQLLLPWMLFLTECFRMWDLILSSSAVIQSGRKANKSLLLIGFQLSSNQFVLQNAGHVFNYCILPDTREMEGFFY